MDGSPVGKPGMQNGMQHGLKPMEKGIQSSQSSFALLFTLFRSPCFLGGNCQGFSSTTGLGGGSGAGFSVPFLFLDVALFDLDLFLSSFFFQFRFFLAGLQAELACNLLLVACRLRLFLTGMLCLDGSGVGFAGRGGVIGGSVSCFGGFKADRSGIGGNTGGAGAGAGDGDLLFGLGLSFFVLFEVMLIYQGPLNSFRAP
jgi:hypothetical protein